jgi:hypothetical protein
MAVAVRGQKGMFVQRHVTGVYVSNTNDTDIKAQNPDRVYFEEIVGNLKRGFRTEFDLMPR